MDLLTSPSVWVCDTVIVRYFIKLKPDKRYMGLGYPTLPNFPGETLQCFSCFLKKKKKKRCHWDNMFMLNIRTSQYEQTVSNCSYRSSLIRVCNVCHSFSTFRYIKGQSNRLRRILCELRCKVQIYLVIMICITKTSLFKQTENFTTNKWKFSDKNSDICHISAQNINCRYSLELSLWGSSKEFPQSIFLSRNKKNNVYPCKPHFYCIKVGCKGSNIIQAYFHDDST